MRYKTAQMLKDEEFKRSTGVQRGTFEKMLEVVETGLRNFGRPAKLSRPQNGFAFNLIKRLDSRKWSARRAKDDL